MNANSSAEFPKFPTTIISSINFSTGLLSTPAESQRDKGSISKENVSNVFTLFVGNIAENVSNKCMEKILKQCGSIKSWKRIQGTDGKYQTFGFCDFEDEPSTLCALRVLNGFELYGEKLVVKADDELLERLSTWEAQYYNESRTKLSANDSDGLPIDEEGKKRDREKLKKIKSIAAKYQPEATEDKKSKHKKKRRSRSSSSSSSTSTGYERYELKQVYKKKQAKYQEYVRYWESREKRQAHHYGKLEKDMRKRNAKRNEADKLLKFLSTYDDKIDDAEWYSGYEYKQRKKYHDKEKRKDEEDRIAEQAEIEMQAKMAEELAKSSSVVDASNSEEPISADIKAEPVQWTTADTKENIIENDTKAFNPITKVLGSGPQSITQKLINVFGNVEEEDIDVLRTRQRLKPFEISKEERLAHMTSDEKKKKFKELLHNLPKSKDELFAIPVDRSLINDAWIDKRVRPWVMKRILEFIGEEEKSFCDFICDKVAKESDPYKILNDIKLILDEDAEVFMIKLWRLIIFETEARKYGLPVAH